MGLTHDMNIGAHAKNAGAGMGAHSKPHAPEGGAHSKPHALEGGAHSKPHSPEGGVHSKPHAPEGGAHSKGTPGTIGRWNPRIVYVVAGAVTAALALGLIGILTVHASDSGDPETSPSSPTLNITVPDAQALREAPTSEELVDGARAAIDTSEVPGSVLLDVPWVEQLPALPSGCEITAATSMLDYYGFEASNVELNEYLEQGWYDDNPHERFVGYCAGEGWMAYPEPIVAALNGYLEAQGQSDRLEAVDITGASPEDIYSLAREGTPVTVWVTTYLQDRSIVYTWYIGDEEFSASEQDHAMVLCGYDDDEVALVDPFGGLEWYPREAFEASYEGRGCMACIIEEK